MLIMKGSLSRFIIGVLALISLITVDMAIEVKAAAVNQITEVTVKNVRISLDGDMITFKDGAYENKEMMEGGGIDNISLGDLNADGVVDAAFEITIFAGASGNAHYLCAIVATPDGPKVIKPIYLGDGVKINNLKINSQKIIINMVFHGPNDLHNFPTMKKKLTFVFKDGNLVSLTPFQPTFLGENIIERLKRR